MPIGDQVWEHARALDVPGLIDLLDGLDDTALASARAWYRKERKQVDQHVLDHAREAPGGRFGARYEIRSLLLVWLGSPALVARQAEWGWFRQEDAGASARRGVWSHDRTWVESFLESAVRADRAPYDVIRAICEAYDLPHPTTPYVVSGWLRSVSPRVTGRDDAGEYEREEASARMRQDPRLHALWPHLLANPDLGSNPWVVTALASLVHDGVLDRTEVIRRTVDQLTTSTTRPQGQRVLVTLLGDLGTTGSEVPGGLAMLQGLLATCHGRATAPLLPLALELVGAGDDLVELAGTVTGRPEKRQRAVLFDFLVDPATPQRLGAAGVREALELVAAVDDAQLADRAREALGRSGMETEQPDVLGLWELRIEPPPPPTHFGEITAFGEATPVQAVHGTTALGGGDVGQLWQIPGALSILNAEVHQHGAAAVKKSLGELPQARYLPGAFGQLVRAWQGDEPLEVHQPNDYAAVAKGDPTRALWIAHVVETLRRLGRSSRLLSTPTYADGTLTLTDLVGRLAECGTFGPLDLLLALLRMRPVDPSAAAALDGLRAVPPDDVLGPTSIADAVAFVRAAIAANGLQAPRLTVADLDAHGWLTDDTIPEDDFWAACLPLDLTPFGARISDLAAPYPWSGGLTSYLVLPHLPDLRIREKLWARSWIKHDGWWQVWLPDAGHVLGRPGILMHAMFLGEYAQTSKYPREMAVAATRKAIGDGTYDAETALVAVEVRLRLGKLNLARCAQVWEELFLVGGLSELWPVALGTAAAACRRPRKPAGLPDLLRMLARYVGEVPDVRLPDELTALASEKGATKSHAEARVLVAALG